MSKKETPIQNNGEGAGQPKKFYKKWWFWVIIVVVAIVIAAVSPDSEETADNADLAQNVNMESTEQESETQTEKSKTQKHIYDAAEVKDVMNGTHTEKIGEYSVITVESKEVTEDILADWYFNYVVKNDFNYCIIVYSDKGNSGAYAIEGIVNKDVEFEIDENGDYSLGDTSNCTVYTPTDNGKLKEVEQTEEPEPAEDDDVPTEYKSALNSANSYSEIMHMSKAAIYDQLISEYGDQFTEDAAQYAIDNMTADWNENALKSAESYSENMHMSKAAIYDQLISEYGDKFTKEEAQYAIDNIVADWNENALQSAIAYQDTMNMSPKAIRDQLISEYGDKFTEEEADYAIEHLE